MTDDDEDEGTVFALQQSRVERLTGDDDVGAIYLDVTDAEDHSEEPEITRIAVAMNRELATKLRDQLNSFIGGN